MLPFFSELSERASRRLCTSVLLAMVTTMFVLSVYQAGLFSKPPEYEYINYEKIRSIQFDCNKIYDESRNDEVKPELKKTSYVDENNVEFALIDTRPILNCLNDDHEFVLESLKRDMILKPDNEPPKTNRISFTPEKFEGSPTNVKNRQALDIYQRIFQDKVKNGFFVDAGAMDCETNSISLPFEQDFNWTGILIEPIPAMYNACIDKHRKAHVVPNCLATENRPRLSPFALATSQLIHDDFADTLDAGTEKIVEMQCIPLYSILLAVDNPKVNLLILDLAGSEYPILKTIPWDKVDIEVITVETGLAGKLFPGSREEIISYMEGQNYQSFDHVDTDGKVDDTHDLFIRKDIVEKYHVTKEM